VALENTSGPEVLRPKWNVLPHVQAAVTCRNGGVSTNGFASLNLAAHVNDDPQLVSQNRERLAAVLNLPQAPCWITQVHSPKIVCADDVAAHKVVAADASWTERPGTVCAVLTADCLPVLLCDAAGTRVAAVHAGWRGLASGILERSLKVFINAGIAADQIKVWLGPAIGPAAYEVDAMVRTAFLQLEPACENCFMETRPGHWQFDLYAAASALLAAQGVTDISGGGWCTYSDTRFYSYRREQTCGRQATLIWLGARTI
jgi:YfiH family protein